MTDKEKHRYLYSYIGQSTPGGYVSLALLQTEDVPDSGDEKALLAGGPMEASHNEAVVCVDSDELDDPVFMEAVEVDLARLGEDRVVPPASQRRCKGQGKVSGKATQSKGEKHSRKRFRIWPGSRKLCASAAGAAGVVHEQVHNEHKEHEAESPECDLQTREAEAESPECDLQTMYPGFAEEAYTALKEVPATAMPTSTHHGEWNYTVSVGKARIQVQLGSRAYYISKPPVPQPHVAWKKHDGPESAWQRACALVSP